MPSGSFPLVWKIYIYIWKFPAWAAAKADLCLSSLSFLALQTNHWPDLRHRIFSYLALGFAYHGWFHQVNP